MTKAYRFLMLLLLSFCATTIFARTLYLQPEVWDNGDVKFAVYSVAPSTGFASGFMTAVSGEEVYQTTIADNVTKVRFYRFNSSRTEPSLDGEWEVSVDLDLPADKNIFVYSGKNGESRVTGSWSVIDERSTFDIIFKDNGSSEDVDYLNLMLLSNSSKISDFVTKGTDVIASFSNVTEADLLAGRAVINARKDHGVLMRDAEFTINLNQPRKLDRIEILAVQYNKSNNGLVINGTAVNNIDSGRYVVDCKDKVVSSINVATPSGKSIYVLAINLFDSKAGNSHVYLADWLNEIGTFTANGSVSKAADGSMQFSANYGSKVNYYEVLPAAGNTFNAGDTIAVAYLRKNVGTTALDIYDAKGTKLFTTDAATATEQVQKFVLTAATDALLLGRAAGSATAIYVPDFSVYQKYIIPTITVSKATKTALGQERNSTSKNPYRVQGVVKTVTLDYEASNKKAIDDGLSELANTVSMIIVDEKNPEGDEIELYAAIPTSSGDITVVPGAPLVVEGKLTHKYDSKSSVAINRGTYKIQKYLVDFVSESKVLQRDSLRYGTMPNYKGATPTKEATAKWTYTFKGWNKTVVPVTEDVTYIAQFDSTLNFYDVTLVLENAWRFDGYEGQKTVELEKSNVGYGTFVSQLYSDKYLKMDLHNQKYQYAVVGWSPAYDIVEGNVVYSALLDSVLRKYTVEFRDRDVIYQSELVEYGITPEYKSEIPTRTPNGEWSYVFKSWEPAYYPVEGPQVYTAKFDSTTVRYEITFLDYNYKLLKSEELGFGAIPVAPTPSRPSTIEWTYIFKGWDEPIVPVSSVKTYVAEYDSVRNQYLITFLDYDGTVLKSYNVEYGAAPFCPNPSRTANVQWTYSFKYWDKDIVKVKGEEVYTAMYDSVLNKYTISFFNYNGALLERKDVAYGVVPAYSGSMPTRPSENNINYEFSGWTPTLVPVTGNASYTAVFEGAEHAVRIIFANYDGTALQSEMVEKGTLPVFKGQTPTRDATPQYTYTFKGWDKTIVTATVGAVYTALYDSLERSYTVQFKNYDGTILQSGVYQYGQTPVYEGPTPEHPASSQFIRTFAGWDKKVEPVEADVVYTARYDLTLVRYLVEFIDYNGAIIYADSLGYGITPTCNNPLRPSTAQYTYYFKGWDKEIVYVTQNAQYYAQYDSIINKYDIKFIADDVVLQTLNLAYGSTPNYTGKTPSRKSNDRCSYSFKGWEPDIVPVTGEMTYVAQFDSTMKKFYVTFNNYDGTRLQYTRFEYGEMPVYDRATPTRPATPEYTYVFAGWDPDLVPVAGVTTYTAKFDAVPVTHLIQFVNYDGLLLQESEVQYGQKPEYTGSVPQRPNSELFAYTFKGWTPEVVNVTAPVVYTAVFDSVQVAYNITFLNYNGSLLDQHIEAVGATPFFEGLMPQKAATGQWTYIFAGWSPALTAVNADATYTATFDSIANRYTVEFVNYNGTPLQSNRLYYGEMPKYEGATPVKPETEEFIFTFAGWEPQITAVESDVVYTAVFDSVASGYIVQFVNYDGTILQSSKVDKGAVPQYAGETPQHPANVQWTYTFKGWLPEIVAAEASTVYVAQFDSVLNQYEVRFVDYDGSELKAEKVDYGIVPTCANPSRQSTEQYDYAFAGWSPAVVAVVENATYQATYDSIRCYRIVVEQTEGFTIKGEGRYQQGAEIVLEAVAQPTYNFLAWSDNVTDNPRKVVISEDLTLGIIFDRDSFEIVLEADPEQGSVEGAGTYVVGSEVTIVAVANEGYEFVQWSDGNKNATRTIVVTENLTLTAQFKEQTGLANINSTGWIEVENNQLIISAPADMTVGVYTVAGQLIYYGYERVVALPQSGQYIVRIGQYAGKVLVK